MLASFPPPRTPLPAPGPGWMPSGWRFTAWRSSSWRWSLGWSRSGAADLRDQLQRAACSVVLNVGEAAGRFSKPDKARFLAIARGSATECAAILDVVRIRGLAPVSDCLAGRTLLVRIVQMLTKLAARRPG
jgi:four helix bundle protein